MRDISLAASRQLLKPETAWPAAAMAAMNTGKNSSFIRAYRLARVALHLLVGLAKAGWILPWVSPARREEMVRAWSRKVLAILHVRVSIHGVLPPMVPRNILVVANHISWLDIYLLNSAHHTHFVSKAEVRDWPLIGWLADKIGTMFIERARKRDTHRINGTIQGMLRSGGLVAVFPEGTTSDGSRIRPFHTSLLQPAIDCESLVVPVALRYPAPDGSANAAPAYIDDMSFGDSLKKIVGEKEIRAELTFLAPIPAAGKTRRELARLAEAAIASELRLANPHSGTGIRADPPAAKP